MASGGGGFRLGLVFVLASALFFSLAGVLTKSIKADVWTISCWRGLVGGLLILAYVGWRGRGRPVREVFGLDGRGWLLAAVGAVASLTFIASFKLTYVGNVTIIYATAPFMAAALGWLLAREVLKWRTLIAAALSFSGVAIIVAGGFASGYLFGDLVALIMTALNAFYIVLIRRFRETPVVLAGGVSALLLFVFGWFVADPLGVSRDDVPLLILFGFTFASAVILWTEGTRLVTATDSALIGTADIPFAIILAWLILAELPPLASFLGGALVLATVLIYALREAKVDATPALVSESRRHGQD
jgi:drug/metabolite transporter (DMT)-like permease